MANPMPGRTGSGNHAESHAQSQQPCAPGAAGESVVDHNFQQVHGRGCRRFAGNIGHRRQIQGQKDRRTNGAAAATKAGQSPGNSAAYQQRSRSVGQFPFADAFCGDQQDQRQPDPPGHHRFGQQGKAESPQRRQRQGCDGKQTHRLPVDLPPSPCHAGDVAHQLGNGQNRDAQRRPYAGRYQRQQEKRAAEPCCAGYERSQKAARRQQQILQHIMMPYFLKKASAPIRSNGEWGLLLMLFFQYGYLYFHLYCRFFRNADRQSIKHRAYRVTTSRKSINDVLRIWPAGTIQRRTNRAANHWTLPLCVYNIQPY